MDRTGWVGLAEYAVGAAPAGWGGVWAVLFTAERATAALCQTVDATAAMRLYEVGETLREACDTLAIEHPTEVAAAPAIDLGPVVHIQDVPTAALVLNRLLHAAVRRADDLLQGPGLDLVERTRLTVLTCDLTAATSTLTRSRA